MARRLGRRGSAGRAALGAAFTLVGGGAGLAAMLATTTNGLLRAAGGAVGGVAGLAGATMTDRVYERKENRDARDQVLDAAVTGSAGDGSVFDVLLATRAVAPFRGRLAERAWLERWCDDRKGPAVAVVAGPAGVGKTRLVTQFALDRPKPWVAGWLHPGRGGTALPAVRACGDPALILVDDADERPDVTELLDDLAADREGPPVRAVLITRNTDLRTRLAGGLELRNRRVLDVAPELPVGPEGSANDRRRWFREALEAYAMERGLPCPGVPAEVIGALTDKPEPILTLQAQALLAVLDAHRARSGWTSARSLPFDEVAAALFVREQRRWNASARLPEWGLTDLTAAVQNRAIAALALAGAVGKSQTEADAALRRVPELTGASPERLVNISRWAAHLYPSDPPWPVRIQPDMLAEWFLVTRLTDETDLARGLHDLTPAQTAALLTLLARASNHMPRAAVRLFVDFVAADTTNLAAAGVAAALDAQAGQQLLDAEFSGLVAEARWSVNALTRLDGQTPADLLPRTGAAIAAARVRCARADANDADIAAALDSLGIRLRGLGRYHQALDAGRESVSLWRPLAEADPGNRPSLARALDNLGANLNALGRYEEALDAFRESVSLWRPLAKTDQGNRPVLARALDNLGANLNALGRYEEALDAGRESVSLWRPLAEADPSSWPVLARALDNLRANLNALGRYEEALEAGWESVSLWRPLAEADPSSWPVLARALDNLGANLDTLGRYEEALDAFRESVSLWRPLAKTDQGDQPVLARALDNLGANLDTLGRYEEALDAFRESVSLWRPLAKTDQGNRPGLARALDRLGSTLRGLRPHEEALGAFRESVGLWRPLAEADPGFRPSLARALDNLGVRLHRLDRYQDALEATDEAVTLWRPLAGSDPARKHDLARALNNLGIYLSALERYKEALDATEEAVELYHGLAEAVPDLYQELYRRALARLHRIHDLQGPRAADG